MFQYNREYFWKFVEVGLATSSMRPDRAIKALARIMRPEIDTFINGYAEPNLNEMAQMAISYINYVSGVAPMPAWFVPFNNNWPE